MKRVVGVDGGDTGWSRLFPISSVGPLLFCRRRALYARRTFGVIRAKGSSCIQSHTSRPYYLLLLLPAVNQLQPQLSACRLFWVLRFVGVNPGVKGMFSLIKPAETNFTDAGLRM